MNLLERFYKYISIDTTSASSKSDTPSTKGQLTLANKLVDELINLGVDSINFDKEHCYVYAMLKGEEDLPKIGFIAHLDTSESASGKNIKPKVIENYDGKDIILDNDIVLSPKVYPDLKNHIGKTLITTNGKTLLGADDKAGIAEIMQMLDKVTSSEEKHGDIFICFTPDEEIGLGTEHLNKKYFHPDFAYTVDGSSLGELSYENFNAATARISIKGTPTHTGSAKGKMVNAVRIATIINSLIPDEIPENTENEQGFYHLKNINGDVSNATIEYLIREFDKDKFEQRKQIIQRIIEELNKKYGDCIILNITDSYYNMKEIIEQNPNLISSTIQVMKENKITPIISLIRGGTDGANITYDGIPCPNIGTGGHNFHSIFEYTTKEDMEKVAELLVSIVKYFAKDNNKEINIKL